FFGKAGELVPEAEEEDHGHGHGASDTAHHKTADHGHGHAHPLKDLSIREICVLAPLLVLVFWMGLLPNHFLNWSRVSMENLAQNYQNYELTIHNPAAPESSASQVARKD
ncbi:MAG: hypothetical protein K2X47_10350, partial [Bdellovibrionales bacterium]|nr:hypothetical protein [Bdellovibrionales bacterium]